MSLALIALLAEPLTDPDATIAAAVPAGFDSERLTPGAFRLRAGDQSYRVTYQASRYAEPIPEIERAELRAPFQDHAAHLTIAWEPREPVPEFGELFTPLGRIAAALRTDAVSCFHLPYWEAFAPADDDTAHALTTGQPLRTFGVLHTKLGCLRHDGGRWKSAFPTRWGAVEIDAHGGPFGPSTENLDRMREIAEHRLRRFRARLLISLLYRPRRIHLDEHGEISVEFQNSITGSRSHFVSERDVRA